VEAGEDTSANHREVTDKEEEVFNYNWFYY
jgi:hypothetical protein